MCGRCVGGGWMNGLKIVSNGRESSRWVSAGCVWCVRDTSGGWVCGVMAVSVRLVVSLIVNISRVQRWEAATKIMLLTRNHMTVAMVARVIRWCRIVVT